VLEGAVIPGGENRAEGAVLPVVAFARWAVESNVPGIAAAAAYTQGEEAMDGLNDSQAKRDRPPGQRVDECEYSGTGSPQVGSAGPR